MPRRKTKKMMPVTRGSSLPARSRTASSIGVPGEHYAVWCLPIPSVSPRLCRPRWAYAEDPTGASMIPVFVTRSAAESFCGIVLARPSIADAMVLPINLPHVNTRRFPWPKQPPAPRKKPPTIQRL